MWTCVGKVLVIQNTATGHRKEIIRVRKIVVPEPLL